MTIRQLLAADRDIDRAVDFYIARSPRSASRLLRAVEAAVARIAESPRSFPVTDEEVAGWETRYFTLRRYPYNVIYAVLESEIIIVGVIHHAQDSATWLDRLPEES